MKIGYIPATFLPWVGGAEIQAHNMANKSEELKHNVDVFLLNNEKITNRQYNLITLNKYLINFIFLFKYYFYIDLTAILKIYFKNLLKKKKYDIWHFHSVNFKTLLYIKPLKKLNQNVCITFQGADIQKFHSIKYGYRFDHKYEKLLKSTLKITDKVFAISEDVKKELKVLGYRGKIIDIPNTVDIKKIKQIKIQKKPPKDCLKIITVARYYESKKGLDLIEKVSKNLLEKKINFIWTLVGRGSDRLKEKKFVKTHPRNFRIISEIKNQNEKYFPNSKLIKIYKKNDIYVNLARIESFGITIIEAIAAGLPVFTFNTKGANELVKNNINGFIVNKYNSLNMANCINNKCKKRLFPKNNISNTISKYDLEYNTKKMIKNYLN